MAHDRPTTPRTRRWTALAVAATTAAAGALVVASPAVADVAPSGQLCFGVDGSPGDAAVVNVTPVEASGLGFGLLVSSDVKSDPPVGSNVKAVDELRDLAQGVYPARLHELGLARALHAVARRSPLRIDIDDSTSGAIDPSTQVALYFVCVEAIQNATKHAGPDATITISLVADGDDLVVTVADDGPGFDAEALAHSRGLLNRDDRVGALDGDFTLETSPGAGTVVTARLPHTLQVAPEVSA